MMLDVDPSSALPVYEQIRQQITRMAVSGVLKPGTRLPTIRQLANDLALAKGTVAKAYALLESSSVVETRGHRGTFIVDTAHQDIDDTENGLAEAAAAFAVAARQYGVDLDTALDELRHQWTLLA
jgi:DNA-binding transcriptional regulator YhcF (GntR family)